MLQVWLSFVMLSSFASAIIQNIPAFSLPEISFQDLLVLERSTVSDLKKQLTTIGAVQITGIPRFLQARNDAIEDAAVCLTRPSNEEVLKLSMPDGSFRYSIAAKTVDGFRGPMSHKCGESALKLRSLIDSACHQVFAALDSMLPNSETLVMKPNYNTFSELFGKGNNLEYLHAYFPSERKSAVVDTAIDFHLDNGLVIAMTTGYFSNGIPSVRSGLYIKLPNGDPVKVVCADSSLILLMGDGSSRWFNRVFDNAFRPVPHSLVIDFPPDVANSRTWFGKMYLPPSDAIIPEGNQRYSSYRTEEVLNLSRLPLACEPHKMVNSLACAADELYCWGQCYPASDYSCGMSAQCVNLKTGFVEPGNNMCMDGNYPGGTYCVLECLATPANESSDDGYCYGTGTSMSMTGFVSLATDPKGSTPCINFLFDEWTLDTEVKMAFACLGALALGLIIQFLNLIRAKTRRIDDLFKRKLVKTVLFALQTLLSYFLMLLAMTYSAELFSMTILGLSLGYALFQPDERAADISSDPCCPAEEKEYEPLESALLSK